MSATAQPLDQVFHALANPTRRAVITRLGKGPATVSELAQPFEMALPSFMQHLDVLEESGLVRSHRLGRMLSFQGLDAGFLIGTHDVDSLVS